MYSCPLPSEKNRRRAVCGGGGDSTQASLLTSSSSLETANKKFPCPVFLMIAKDCSERLSTVGLSIGLIIPRDWSVSGHVVRASLQIRHRNALTEIAWEDAVQGLGGSVYRSLIEKQRIVSGIVVYISQRVLQTVTSLGVVSLVFRKHDLLKIANFNPQQEARFSLRKKN